MAYTPLKGRENVKKLSDGNSGVRLQDSTAKVAGILNGGAAPSSNKGRQGNKSGCTGCGR